MRNLRYICAQPRTLYYAWQVEVMINNFLKNGITPRNIDILVAWNPNDETSDARNIDLWQKLVKKYTNVRFFFYQDTRVEPIHYISSIRPNILKQHFKAFPELMLEAIFYHDCDIVFSKPPDFSRFLNDNIWYLSDTSSYINASYILSKGFDVYNKMCEIVEIDNLIPRLMNSHSGGAQYIMKNVDQFFWEKVEKDCENMFFEITQLNNRKRENDPNYHELQIWCSDMWSVLWNGWLRGNETKIVGELDFTWATDPIERWDSNVIFHNAGVTCPCDHAFYKAMYINVLPYNVPDTFDQNKAGYMYYREVMDTAANSCLI